MFRLSTHKSGNARVTRNPAQSGKAGDLVGQDLAIPQRRSLPRAPQRRWIRWGPLLSSDDNSRPDEMSRLMRREELGIVSAKAPINAAGCDFPGSTRS